MRLSSDASVNLSRMTITSDDRVPLGQVRARLSEIQTLLDEAERGWADVEAGRVKPIAALRAKYARRR